MTMAECTTTLTIKHVTIVTANTHEGVLMLHDFSFKTPGELLASLTKKDHIEAGMMTEV